MTAVQSDLTGLADQRPAPSLALWPVSALFWLSGWAAILYELAWQRTLFAAVGINIEAVTLIVTAFMAGLGVGSLLGGVVSRSPTRDFLRWFALMELSVAVFGLCSLPLLRTVGTWTLGLSPWGVGTVIFALLLIPTLGMGATLPLLVAQRAQRWSNVGWSVGSLYFINTLGSAMAAFASVFFLMRGLGLQGVVWFAATCNVLAAFGALLWRHWEERR